jgi:hypothetical protein
VRASVLKAALVAGAVVAAIAVTLFMLPRDEEVLPPVYQGGPPETLAPPPKSRPAPTTTAPAAPCLGSVREYCEESGGKCPTYAESVARVKRDYCPLKRDMVRLVVEHCVGEHHSIRTSAGLFGGTTYFDAKGRLIAARQFSDANSYCGGTSFSKTYGTIPVCTTEFMKVDVCRE